MSFSAIIPVALMAQANADLEALGYGPNNFSVPAYGNATPTHGVLHSWDDPAFQADVASLPGVIIQANGTPQALTRAVCTTAGSKWGADAPQLPSAGMVLIGELYQTQNEAGAQLWTVLQSFDRTIFNAPPETYPALLAPTRTPGVIAPWVQPESTNPYKLVEPFTQLPERCKHVGKTWRTTVDNNVWEPGVFGWAEVV